MSSSWQQLLASSRRSRTSLCESGSKFGASGAGVYVALTSCKSKIRSRLGNENSPHPPSPELGLTSCKSKIRSRSGNAILRTPRAPSSAALSLAFSPHGRFVTSMPLLDSTVELLRCCPLRAGRKVKRAVPGSSLEL
ncbi:unnamed protein product [Laminaria digitata]